MDIVKRTQDVFVSLADAAAATLQPAGRGAAVAATLRESGLLFEELHEYVDSDELRRLLALIGQSRDSDDATTVARRATLRELHDLLPGRAWDDVLAEHAVFDRGLLTMLLTALAVWARIAVRFGTDGDPRSLAVRERHRLELRELLGAGAGDGASVERWLACHTPEADVAAARQLATMIQRLGLSDPE
mgnify:CR=1 FL=1